MIAAAIIAVVVLAILIWIGFVKIAARADARDAQAYRAERREYKGWPADGSDEP